MSLVREPAIAFWVMLFPIILSTLFNVMFGGLEEAAYELKAVPVAVVEDAGGGADGLAVGSFDQMLDALSDGDDALLAPVRASSRDEAMGLLRSGDAVGVITLDADGWPDLEVSPASGDVGVSMDGIERTVLYDVVNNYVRTRTAAEDIARADPLAVASLMATSLGALVGALPGVPEGAKGGILTGITCLLSLFAGLYGTPAMNFADQVARDLPGRRR